MECSNHTHIITFIAGIVVGFIVLIVLLCLIHMLIARKGRKRDRTPVDTNQLQHDYERLDVAGIHLEVNSSDDDKMH